MLRARLLIVGLGLLLGAAGPWAADAVAKKPPLILREGQGGPVAPAPSHLGVEVIEIKPNGCGYGTSSAPPEELLTNSFSKDQINAATKKLNCEELFPGTLSLTGTLILLTVSSNGKGKLTTSLVDHTSEGHCQYAVTKLASTLSFPKYFSAVPFTGTGKRMPTSLASCPKKEAVEIWLYLVRWDGSKFNTIYAET
jgi:hypothetical protein